MMTNALYTFIFLKASYARILFDRFNENHLLSMTDNLIMYIL